MHHIILYTRDGCHLCKKAKQDLMELKNELSFSFEEKNIAQSDELTEQYGLMIPVVVIDGDVVTYGFVNKFDISKRLQ
ncbi:glutaredoxin family protein [Neobacillus sp. SM06]|uniref:glutaredoxin family protein n=1 Tax=Neobacillus sp. SM06 TaxID=3422492 RepID=UPI003D2BF529